MGLHQRTRRNGLHRLILLPGNRWKRIPKHRQILCGEVMNSQQSAISNQQSGQIFFQKILSAISEKTSHLTKVSSLLIADSRLLMAILLFLCSCGDEGLIDPHGETTLPPPDTRDSKRSTFQRLRVPRGHTSTLTPSRNSRCASAAHAISAAQHIGR